MESLKIAQYFNCSSTSQESQEKQRKLLKEVDVNYSKPKLFPGKQRMKKRWAGYTSLHFTAAKNDLDLTIALLERGANLVKQGFTDGCTPLHVAAVNKSVYKKSGQLPKYSIIDTLLSRQVKINNTLNPKCEDGVSHFHIACIVNHIAAVKFFTKAKLPLDQSTNTNCYWLPGYTPLHCAIEYSSVEAADILLRHGADVRVENAKGVSCLHLLIELTMNMTDFIVIGKRTLSMPYEEEIIRLETIINVVLETRENDGIFMDDTELSTLHIACMLRDKSIVEDFLKKAVDVNIPIKSNSKSWPGWTPLHFAVCFNIEMTTLLIENGANIMIKNSKGETALDLCAKRFTSLNLHLILSMQNQFKDIVMSDNRTKLSDVLVAMNNCGKFRSFLQTLRDCNIKIPLDSPIWAGYSLMHLSVCLNEKTKSRSFMDRSFDVPEIVDTVLKRYNCTTDEEALYVKRIELCLEYYCSLSQKDAKGQTPIHLAFNMLRKATVKQLLSHSKDNVVDSNGWSHLHIACAVGHLDAVKKYVDGGTNVNSQSRTGFDWPDNWRTQNVRANSTPLHIAAAFDHEDVVKCLLKNSGDVYAQDSLGFTPIHLSMSPNIANWLFKATPNLRDSVSVAGLSHLHVAAWADNPKAVDKLLLNGAKVDRIVKRSVDKELSSLDSLAGKTPLLLASCDKVIKRLLKAGANVHAKDPKGISALQHAMRAETGEFDETFTRLLRAGKCEVDSCGMTLLHAACGHRDIKWARRLVEQGVDDVNARISDDGNHFFGATPLHVLIEVDYMLGFYGDDLVDFVELLVNEGADVSLDCQKATPIHLIYNSIYWDGPSLDHPKGQFYAIAGDFMLKNQKSYDVNPINSHGFSHFHFACVRNDVETATKFLDHGVDVNESLDPLDDRDELEVQDNEGYTPLHFAMAHRSRDVAFLLLERGADVNAEDAEGNKPLHVAIKNNFVDLPLIESMLSLGADIHATNMSNESLLYCLLDSDDLTLKKLDFFLNCGCLINALSTTNTFHLGIIGLAMRNAAATELLLILERLIRVDEVRDAIQNGFSVIQSIVAIDEDDELTLDIYLNAIQLFINNGCDIDHQDTEGKTALHAAASFCNLKAIEALLLLGADINVSNNESMCPFSDKIIGCADEHYNESGKLVIVKAVACHVWKMRLTGLGLSELNLRCLKKVEDQFSLTDLLEQSCQDELSKAAETEICEGLTVRDFLSELGAVAEYPRMCPIQRDIIDKYFKCTVDLRREFPEFCGLLAFQYRKALCRVKLWQPAKAALLSIYQVELPDLCLEAILRYLTNSEMKLITNLAKELN